METNAVKLEPVEPFGPYYPDLGATVAKFRRVRNPSREQRLAHGEAVLEAIRNKQRSEFARHVSVRPHCASGTWHTDADDIIRAMQQQNRASQLAAVNKDRRDRTPEQWRALYDEAMKEKKTREVAAAEKPKKPPRLKRPKTPKAATGRLVVVTATFCGRGSSEAQARKQCREAGGTKSLTDLGYVVYLVHPDTKVSDVGKFRYPKGHPPVIIKDKRLRVAA